MMTRKSSISPQHSAARVALFAALLSGSAMAAAQDVTAPGPEMEIPDPVESTQPVEPVIAAPPPIAPPPVETPPVEAPMIIIPSTPPVAEKPPIARETVVPAPATKAAPQPQKSAAKPVPARAAPAQAAIQPATDVAPAEGTGSAILPEASPIAVPDLLEPVAVAPYSDEVTAEPADNSNAEENWLLAAAGLGLLGAAGGAAVVAGKRRRRRELSRTANRRVDPTAVPAAKPAIAEPRLQERIAPQWATSPAMAPPLASGYQDQRAAPQPMAAEVAQRRTDPMFATKVSGPPITDPLFSAKVEVPPVTDPLFRTHPDYAGPSAKPAGNAAPLASTGKAHVGNSKSLKPEFAV